MTEHLPLIQFRQLLDRVPQRLPVQLRVAVVHRVRGVPGEFDADFLTDTRVGEGGVEAVAEGVEGATPELV